MVTTLWWFAGFLTLAMVAGGSASLWVHAQQHSRWAERVVLAAVVFYGVVLLLAVAVQFITDHLPI